MRRIVNNVRILITIRYTIIIIGSSTVTKKTTNKTKQKTFVLRCSH